jgi:hypothetical protein
MNQYIHAIASVGLLLGASAPKEQATSATRASTDWLVADAVAALMRPTDVDGLTRAVDRLRSAPVYLRMSALPDLLTMLQSSDTVEVYDYDPPDGGDDLRMLAGRAAWGLEAGMGIALPPVDAHQNADERARIVELARAQADAYVISVREMVKEYGIGDNPEALAARYKDALGARFKKDHACFDDTAVALFDEMLHEFFPIGKKLDDLELIVGQPAASLVDGRRLETRPQVGTWTAEYRCDSGFSGVAYYLLIEGDVIQRVSRKSID